MSVLQNEKNKDFFSGFSPTLTNYREKSVAEPADITLSPPTFCLNRQEFSAATAFNFCGCVISVICEKQHYVTAFLHMASLSYNSHFFIILSTNTYIQLCGFCSKSLGKHNKSLTAVDRESGSTRRGNYKITSSIHKL